VFIARNAIQLAADGQRRSYFMAKYKAEQDATEANERERRSKHKARRAAERLQKSADLIK
jgi:hypothetical protein